MVRFTRRYSRFRSRFRYKSKPKGGSDSWHHQIHHGKVTNAQYYNL